MMMLAGSNAFADAHIVSISRAAGTIKVVSNGTPIVARAGAKFAVPARIETGIDGSIKVEQMSSTLDIGPNSIVVIPGPAKDGSEKIIQGLGRALYSVKPRTSRSFSVETPYLVSVVKGTMFSVAIQDGGAEVALLEGSVELNASGIEPVLMHPNERAWRGSGESSIKVFKIDATPPQASTFRDSSSLERTPSAASVDTDLTAELNTIVAVRREERATVPLTDIPGSVPTPVPGAPTPSDPAPTPDNAPMPTPAPESPLPDVPGIPGNPPDDDDDSAGCAHKKCDSDDDHDNGRGND
jgi:hypothetical protein